MPIDSKKNKNIKKDLSVKNQITNLVFKIQTQNQIQPKVQIATDNIPYYVSMYQNPNSDMSFNNTTKALQTRNLVIQNPPVCYADTSNSYDLVNKAHLNKYVGFDLSNGDRWFCEDWTNGTTSGVYNWDLSANNGNITTEIFMLNSSSVNLNHNGVLALYSYNTIGFKQARLPLIFNSNKIKKMRFIVALTNGRNSGFSFGFFENGIFAASNKFFCGYSAGGNNAGNGGYYFNINNSLKYNLDPINYPLGGDNILDVYSVNNKWILMEIEQSVDKKLTFYMTNLTAGGIRVAYPTNDIISSYNGSIIFYYTSNTATSNSRYAYIDYVDWIVSP